MGTCESYHQQIASLRPSIDCSRLGAFHKEANRRDDDREYDYDLNYARQSHSPPSGADYTLESNRGCRDTPALPHGIPTSLLLDTYSIWQEVFIQQQRDSSARIKMSLTASASCLCLAIHCGRVGECHLPHAAMSAGCHFPALGRLTGSQMGIDSQ
jgi:hypothetical protein